MPNKKSAEEVIDELAIAVKAGFDEVARRFDRMHDEMDAGFKEVNEHLDRIEYYVSGHDRRIEVLEDRMIQVARKLGISFSR